METAIFRISGSLFWVLVQGFGDFGGRGFFHSDCHIAGVSPSEVISFEKLPSPRGIVDSRAVIIWVVPKIRVPFWCP